jgi:hypothetical protein
VSGGIRGRRDVRVWEDRQERNDVGGQGGERMVGEEGLKRGRVKATKPLEKQLGGNK